METVIFRERMTDEDEVSISILHDKKFVSVDIRGKVEGQGFLHIPIHIDGDYERELVIIRNELCSLVAGEIVHSGLNAKTVTFEGGYTELVETIAKYRGKLSVETVLLLINGITRLIQEDYTTGYPIATRERYLNMAELLDRYVDIPIQLSQAKTVEDYDDIAADIIELEFDDKYLWKFPDLIAIDTILVGVTCTLRHQILAVKNPDCVNTIDMLGDTMRPYTEQLQAMINSAIVMFKAVGAVTKSEGIPVIDSMLMEH